MIGTGFLVGRDELTNFKFDPSRPHAGCRLCGRVFQSDQNRLGSWEGMPEWRVYHNKLHSEADHRLFRLSGRKFSPEAVQRLTSYGIVDFGGILVDDEVSHSAATAPRAPIDDVEGS